MKVVRGYKTELDLNNEQRTACMKHAGCSRFAYNWGLARSQETYRTTGKRPTAIDLHKQLNALKQTSFPWMYETSKCAPQEALRDLDKAYKHFFRRVELKKQGKWKGKLGFPRLKKKSKAIGSFRLTGAIRLFSDAIQLPRLGRLRLHEYDYIPMLMGLDPLLAFQAPVIRCVECQPQDTTDRNHDSRHPQDVPERGSHAHNSTLLTNSPGEDQVPGIGSIFVQGLHQIEHHQSGQ